MEAPTQTSHSSSGRHISVFLMLYSGLKAPVAAGDIFTGSYVCTQGITGLSVVIDSWSESPLARFIFFPLPQSIHECEGEFHLTGSWTAASRSLEFIPGDWIRNPCGFGSVGLRGTLSDTGVEYSGAITGSSGGCSTLSTFKARSSSLLGHAAQLL